MTAQKLLTPKKTEASEARTDYSLLIKRIQKAIDQADSIPSNIRDTLKNRRLWKHLNADQMLQWAKLSQIAGEIPLSVEVFGYLTRSFPDFDQGWILFMELLSVLGRNEELAVQVEKARDYLSEEVISAWVKLAGQGKLEDPLEKSPKDDAAAAPIETMNRKRELMSLFMTLFSGREDCFARQWADKKENKSGYVPVRYAMGIKHVEEHLSGLKTYGIYLLRGDSTVQCGVIDADIHAEYRNRKITAAQKRLVSREKYYMVNQIMEKSQELGICPLLEYSGQKGYHLWFFFKSPVPALKVKSFLTRIAEPVNHDISSFNLEVFPKQAQLSGKGLGNLVKLPLGIHRKSGKPSFFMACKKHDIESQLDFLSRVKPGGPEILDNINLKEEVGEPPKEHLVLHPRLAAYAKDYPELFQLERMCPPMGQVIGACKEGRNISSREEKVLFQTIGFLPRARYLMHYLMAFGSDYNPHMVDFKLSRISGSPLGCRRIHSLLSFTSDYCDLEPDTTGYLHPLIHLDTWKKIAEKKTPKSERIENLQDALENMKTAIIQLQRFIA